MQQITLDLDHDENAHPGPVMEPERELQLIALMAQAIVAVVQREQGEDDETN